MAAKCKWHLGPVPKLHTDTLKAVILEYIDKSKRHNLKKFDFDGHYNAATVNSKVRFDELAKIDDFICQLLKASPTARICRSVFKAALNEAIMERRKMEFHSARIPQSKFIHMVAKQVLRV